MFASSRARSVRRGGRSAAGSAARPGPPPSGSPYRAGTGRKPRCAAGLRQHTVADGAPRRYQGELARVAVMNVGRADSGQQGIRPAARRTPRCAPLFFMLDLKGRNALASGSSSPRASRLPPAFRNSAMAAALAASFSAARCPR